MRLGALALAVGLLVGLSLPLIAQQPAQPPSPVLIVPGQSVAGIVLGRSVQDVMRRLGPPSEVRTVRDATLYVFSRFGLTVYGDGDLIRAVSATNSLLRTPQGIGLGTSEEEVHRVYGPQFSNAVVEGFPGISYDHLGVAFGFDRASVAVILVFLPRTEATAGFVSLPRVETLKPFSAETRFMSLPGYLRQLVFEQTGQWISYREALRMIQQQAQVRG